MAALLVLRRCGVRGSGGNALLVPRRPLSAETARGTALAHVLEAARRRLLERAADEAERLAARLDAQRLLECVSGRDAASQLAHADEPLDPPARARFEALVERRAGGEPLAYILGEAWFYGRRFAVTPDVLVPRPETERLVEAALAHLDALLPCAERLTICDVGTGSGILALSVCCERSDVWATASDVEPAALAVAERNARALGVDGRVVFQLGDALRALRGAPPFDCILANLPYLRSAELPPRPAALGFEPRVALDGGPDGLAAYRRLLLDAPTLVADGGVLLMEAGPDTVEALAKLAQRVFGERAQVRVERDYARRERLVEVTKSAIP